MLLLDMTFIRVMQNEDLDRVYAIESAAYPTPWDRNTLRDCLLLGCDCRVLERVLESVIELAGFVICRYQANTCHVLNLCVNPALQNKGYGQLLLQDVIDSCSASHIDSLLLDVRPSNTQAQHLYAKMGFQYVRIKRGYYRDELGIENAIVLKKSI